MFGDWRYKLVIVQVCFAKYYNYDKCIFQLINFYFLVTPFNDNLENSNLLSLDNYHKCSQVSLIYKQNGDKYLF